MLYTFKTMTQKTFQIELDDSVTISEVKAKIAQDYSDPDHPVEMMKIIFNGKIYSDSETVGSMGYEGEKFIVVMNPKRRAEATSAAPPLKVPSPNATLTSTSASTASASSLSPASAEAQPVLAPPCAPDIPEEHIGTVEAIMLMGYDQPEVIKALKVAFWNGDRAVEYLLNGIPTSAQAAPAAPVDSKVEALRNKNARSQGASSTEAPAPSASTMLTVPPEPMEEEEDPATFMSHPTFYELRRIVQYNPAALPEIIKEIQNSNPEMMAYIRDNKTTFLARLNEPIVEDTVEGDEILEQPQHIPEGSDQGIGGVGGTEGPQTVDLSFTPAEVDAIERIKAMGFSEQLVLEAFVVCNRNEHLTLNYILSRLNEED
ncbi:hypothetical protein L596_029912 [Steinernema carpocapsae]|uniref:UV excision repair protein RAD23 n=1 Tax=Steinernema carpocapsae TaxID=34508 RepID=A0A4U5LR75_STECR|nr:hypothetical protein L596_029912 [Steinernema carpocapsae]